MCIKNILLFEFQILGMLGTMSTNVSATNFSGVGTADAPGAGAPVKFEVKGHPCGSAEVALCSEAV